MKYIRTKDGVYSEIKYKIAKALFSMFEEEQAGIMPTQKTNFNIINQADTIEELCDEFVFFEKGNISIVSCLAEAKDRLLEYRDFDNYEPRLIGRIKVGLDVKAVAEFEEIKEGKYKGCYDWILL